LEPPDQSLLFEPAQEGIDAALRRADPSRAESRDALDEVEAAPRAAAKRKKEGAAGREHGFHRHIISDPEIILQLRTQGSSRREAGSADPPEVLSSGCG
jgi:hypothetical protein